MKTIVFAIISAAITTTVCEDVSVWRQRAQEALTASLKQTINTRKAKNVILCIGDGMGMTTVTPARIYKGQKQGRVGEMEKFAFEEFPNVALSKTFSNDRQVTESGAASNAMLAGTKINSNTLGLNTKAVRTDCNTAKGNEITSILDWSLDEGKRVGLVTSARVTHATPAAAYAHVADRWWEADSDIPAEAKAQGCTDITHQLVYNNTGINVILGGGRRNFYPNTTKDPEYSAKTGLRWDNLDLTQVWVDEKVERKVSHKYVWNKDQFDSVDPKDTDYLLGLFERSHMQYEMNRAEDTAGEPSLAEMVDKAIQVLSRDDKGYFLLVESGRIDHAHHANQAKLALDETEAFDNAVKKIVERTAEEDTLVIVTADHSHPFTMGSWASLNNDILGFVDKVGYDTEPPTDGFPYLSLSYANGPGPTERTNLTGQDVTDKDYKYPAMVPMAYDSHGGEDVVIYARGPMSHLINGVQENQYIAHVMAYASCVGDNKDHCKTDNTKDIPVCAGGSTLYHSLVVMVTLFAVTINLI